MAFNNGLATVLGALIVGTGIAASGAVSESWKQNLDQQTAAACWDPNAIANADALATQEATSLLKADYPPSMSQAAQNAVTASFSATLKDHSFVGGSLASGTINCQASIAYSYTRPDGTKYSSDNGSIVTYSLNPASDGWSASMSNASIPSGDIAYVDDGGQSAASSN